MGLDKDVKDSDLEALLAEAETALKPDYKWRQGQKIESKASEWILDGLIHKGYFHALYAPAKLGKTTLVLDFLFHLFSKQMQSFLNLSLNSEKNWQLYLIGPDMHVELWEKLLNSAGLLKEDGMLSERVQVVHPEALEDGLNQVDINGYAEEARKAKARGEEPIFVFDCYSTMVANTKGMSASEVSDLYYRPLRKLKNAMSATGATTILLHHSSKTSRSMGAVDAAAGNSGFSRIPDILIKLDWLKPHQDFDKNADRRIILNATGRIDPVGLLIERNSESGHFESVGELADAKHRASMSEAMSQLKNDYSRALDIIGGRDEVGAGITASELAVECNWSRFKGRRVLKYLYERGFVWYVDDTPGGPGAGRPSAIYRYWESKPQNPHMWEEIAQTPDKCTGHVRKNSSDSSSSDVRAGERERGVHLGGPPKPIQGFGNLAPGARVDRKIGDEWDTGWIVKDSRGGNHTIWKYPNLNKFICNQRIDIEIRVSDDEEL